MVYALMDYSCDRTVLGQGHHGLGANSVRGVTALRTNIRGFPSASIISTVRLSVPRSSGEGRDGTIAKSQCFRLTW